MIDHSTETITHKLIASKQYKGQFANNMLHGLGMYRW